MNYFPRCCLPLSRDVSWISRPLHSQLIAILRVLQTTAEKVPAHADSASTVVSSLLFLRYICPTIVHPRLAGVQGAIHEQCVHHTH